MYIWEHLPMLLSVKQTAEILGVNAATIYSMLKQSDTLPKVLVGKTYKISRAGLRRMVDGAASA